MYDADKKTNTNLELKITKNKDDKLSVKLTADKEFLNNAKYPVTIDPEVNLFGSSNIQTSDVSIDHPDAAYVANSVCGNKTICHQKHHKGHNFFNHFHVKLSYIKHSIHSFYVIGG